jgi:hypothetical protein
MTYAPRPPYHPMTQREIERYHRPIKNVVKFLHYYFPWALDPELSRFMDYYNKYRSYEFLNVTLADVCFGRHPEILTKRDKLKEKSSL